MSMKKKFFLIILILNIFIILFNNSASVNNNTATMSDAEYDKVATDSIATKSIASKSVATKSIIKKEKPKEIIPIKYVGEKVIEGKDGWLFFDENIKEYTGEFSIKDSELKKYTENYIRLKKLVEDTFNKKLIFIVFPEKEEVYSEFMPTYPIVDEEERVMKIRKYLEENSDVCYLYPKEELINAKDYYKVYYKYDNHYNKVGAFIGNEILKKEVGLEETKLSDVNIKRTSVNTGNLILLSYDKEDKKNDDFDYEIEYKTDISIAQMKDKEEYQKYLSTSKNKKKVVFIGDSFRFNIMEFLQKDYYESTFMFSGQTTFSDEQLNDVLDADVIIIEAVERFEKTTFAPTVDVLVTLFEKLKRNTNK